MNGVRRKETSRSFLSVFGLREQRGTHRVCGREQRVDMT